MTSATPLLHEFEIGFTDGGDDDEDIDNSNNRSDRCNKTHAIIITSVVLIMVLVPVAIGVGYIHVDKPQGNMTNLESLQVAKGIQPLCEQWKADKSSGKCARWECPPVILISFDGFRYDYLNLNRTPTFKRVMENGVRALYMRPSYPTRTFPNHYTIVTGLYPESHGIVDNSMYDPILNKTGSVGPEYLNAYWWSGEPIWNTIQRSHKKSATMFWPGSEANIGGARPTYWLPFNRDKPFEERVQQVLDWIKISDDSRPDLITLYFNEPDAAGHAYGPNSEQVAAAVKNVDSQLSLLLDGLSKEDILDCVNIVIVSDHGMTDYSETSYFDVSTRITNLNDYHFVPFANSRLRSKTGEAPDETIRRLGCDDHVTMYKKEDLPVRLHYAANRRIDPVVMMPEEGWYTVSSPPPPTHRGGAHGWDNSLANMRSIFMAMGPYFKQKYTSHPIENIEIYDLLCTTMDVTPAPNNGTMGSLDHLLRYTLDRQQPKAPRPSACSAGASAPVNACQRTDLSSFNERTVSIDTETCFIDFRGNYRSHFDTERRLVKTVLIRDRVRWLELEAHRVSSMCAEGQVSPQRQLSPEDWANLTSDGAVTPVLMHWTMDVSSAPSTLLVPMYRAFVPYWTTLVDMVNQNLKQDSDLVIMGPIFDSDSDGRADPVSNQVIPSHYFVSIIRAEMASPLAITSWVVPHRSLYTSCRNERTWLSHHVARLRDIELLTAMTFLFNGLADTKLRLYLPPLPSI